jgi:adenylate cyclase 1
LLANIILFISVNVAGIFINNVTQRAQRKTFVDTRNCIAARKEIQQENEKLVRVALEVPDYSAWRKCIIYLLLWKHFYF